MSFARSFSLSAMCHLAGFVFIVISFDKTSLAHGLECYFWGSFVRKEELLPASSRSLDVPEDDKSSLSADRDAFFWIWSRALGPDKGGVMLSAGPFEAPAPLKFLGPRVNLEEGRDEDSAGLPESPASLPIRLRYPRP